MVSNDFFNFNFSLNFKRWTKLKQGVYKSWKSWKNPGILLRILEFKRILEFLENPWNSNPGKITLKSIFVDICRYLSTFVDILWIG